MLEKLRSLGSAAKDFLLYIIAPILGIIGYIFFLKQKQGVLEDQLSREKGKTEIVEFEAEYKEIKKDADDKEADARNSFAEFTKHPSDGGDPNV